MSIVSPDKAPEQRTPEGGAPTPDDVFCRRPSPQVEWVDVQGEVVVWNADTESLHLLDAIAALIFQLMDGTTPLEVTSRELAEAFGRSLDQVRDDVLHFAAQLADIGVAERVA